MSETVGSFQITVRISPVNEFDPEDTGTVTTLTVDEDTLVGTVVGSVVGGESGTGDKAGTPHADIVYRSFTLLNLNI